MGEVVWGHDNATEPNIRDLALWSGTGEVTSTGDPEILTLEIGEEMISETWQLGIMTAVIRYDHYRTGSGITPVIQYKTADTKLNCEAVSSWTTYNGNNFSCLGWVIIRVANE